MGSQERGGRAPIVRRVIHHLRRIGARIRSREAWLRAGGLHLVLIGLLACAPASEQQLVPRSTLFIGIDVSESFQGGGRYDDAMAFAAHYVYGHLNGLGELEQPRALFVGSIGGERPGEPQAFHPIHDFEDKTPGEIEADLREWFSPDDNYTDFNAFFQRAATLVKRQNLALAPVTLVLFTDGIPDVGTRDVGPDDPERYARIDLDPLEYLARNVTIRVLYPDPTVAVRWERDVPRDRVRMWTVDAVVMEGWRNQLREPMQLASASLDDPRVGSRRGSQGGARAPEPTRTAVEADSGQANEDAGLDRPAEPQDDEPDMAGPDTAEAPPPAAEPEQTAPRESVQRQPVPQPDLWRWIKDNVDFRVRRTIL